ncbi:MAG: hypothetical protein WCL14_04215 [Bacteroidota bacterium]
MKKILPFLLIFFCQFSFGQNLVPNPSFENYISCPTGTIEADSCLNWHNFGNSPDYFNICAGIFGGVFCETIFKPRHVGLAKLFSLSSYLKVFEKSEAFLFGSFW